MFEEVVSSLKFLGDYQGAQARELVAEGDVRASRAEVFLTRAQSHCAGTVKQKP